MTTLNYTVEENAGTGTGSVKVEWSGLGDGDDGQPFPCALPSCS